MPTRAETALAFVFVLVFPADAAPGSAGAVPPTCAREAVRLTQARLLRERPHPATAVVAQLSAGAFVYLCEISDGFQRLMYPRANEAVDCTFREQQNACPTGWTEVPVPVEVLG